MGYSNFKKISQVTQRFGLDHRLYPVFETKIKPVKPSRWLLETLEIAHVVPLSNEKVKAERIISPILVEVAKHFREQITLFSGEELTVEPAKDLSGPCDFFFALHPPKIEMEAPIISLTEAKNEDMEWGIAQCCAQMYAASLYNLQHDKPTHTIYGCATTGSEWQFLKFEQGLFTIDNRSFTEISQVLGVWHNIIHRFVP